MKPGDCPTAFTKQFIPVVQPLRDRLLDLINKKCSNKDFDQLVADFKIYHHGRKAPTSRAGIILHILFILDRGMEADEACDCMVRMEDFAKIPEVD